MRPIISYWRLIGQLLTRMLNFVIFRLDFSKRVFDFRIIYQVSPVFVFIKSTLISYDVQAVPRSSDGHVHSSVVIHETQASIFVRSHT
jgi:hypothetical protein